MIIIKLLLFLLLFATTSLLYSTNKPNQTKPSPYYFIPTKLLLHSRFFPFPKFSAFYSKTDVLRQISPFQHLFSFHNQHPSISNITHLDVSIDLRSDPIHHDREITPIASDHLDRIHTSDRRSLPSLIAPIRPGSFHLSRRPEHLEAIHKYKTSRPRLSSRFHQLTNDERIECERPSDLPQQHISVCSSSINIWHL